MGFVQKLGLLSFVKENNLECLYLPSLETGIENWMWDVTCNFHVLVNEVKVRIVSMMDFLGVQSKSIPICRKYANSVHCIAF